MTHGLVHQLTLRTSTIHIIVASETHATPAVKTTYELVHRFLFMGRAQFHISPIIMPRAPTAKRAAKRSTSGRSRSAIQRPARFPKRHVATAGIVEKKPSGSH